MKRLLIAIQLAAVVPTAATAQTTYSYRFQNTLTEETDTGPTLAPITSCGAVSNTFGTDAIITTAGQCGTTAQTVRFFNEGEGFQHSNGLITGTYTIDIFFKVPAYNGYQRIIDFQNSATDAGLYTLGNCLNFYPNGNSGACPFFVAGNYYLYTLVRDGATNLVDVYVNGSLFVSAYNDAAGTYAAATTATPILLFRDDNAVACEDRDGAIRYFAIRNSTSNAVQVAGTYSNICSIALSQDGGGISIDAQHENRANRIRWSTVSENKLADYSVERSSDASTWKALGETVRASGQSSYSLVDAQPLPRDNYYRIRARRADGSVILSSTTRIASQTASREWTLLANPAQSFIQLTATTTSGGTKMSTEIRLLDARGAVVFKTSTTAHDLRIPIEGLANGLYTIVVSSARASEVYRVQVQH